MKSLHRLGLTAITTATILFSSVAPVAANGLETTIQEQRNQVTQITGEINALQAEITQLNAEIESNENTLNETQVALLETKLKIEEAQAEIATLQESIDKRVEILKERATSLQQQNRTNIVVDVVLNSQNIADLIQNISSVTALFQSDTDIMEALAVDQAAVAEQEAELENQYEILDEQKAEAEEQLATLRDNETRKETALSSLETNLNTVRTELQNNEAELARIEAAAAAVISQSQAANVAPVANNGGGSTNPATPNNRPTAPAPAAVGGGSVVGIAQRYLGVPYRWGGTTPAGFDCSGFVVYSFRQAGRRTPPRTAQAQWNASTRVSNPVPGDLAFFSNGGGIFHVGIYIGGGQMVHASLSRGIVIQGVRDSFWGPRLAGFGRL